MYHGPRFDESDGASDNSFIEAEIALQPLIDQAKRRARLRRLGYAAAALAAAGIAAGLALSQTSSPTRNVPPGFTVAKARGPVAHAVIRYRGNMWIADLTGLEHPAKVTEEVWYDTRGGLWRDVARVDGRIRTDRSGVCAVSPKELPCGSTPPLAYLRGRPPGDIVVSKRPSLSAGSFSFVLRKHAAGGAPQSFHEPLTGRVLAYGLPAARRALGRTPLWLGPRFHGYALRSVTTGTYPFGTTKTGALRPARFVRFYYGNALDENYAVSVEEFGSIRPYFYKQGPRPGSIERDGPSIARMTQDGLLLRVMSESRRFQLTGANAIALAKALRPLARGLETLPTLRQQ